MVVDVGGEKMRERAEQIIGAHLFDPTTTATFPMEDIVSLARDVLALCDRVEAAELKAKAFDELAPPPGFGTEEERGHHWKEAYIARMLEGVAAEKQVEALEEALKRIYLEAQGL